MRPEFRRHCFSLVGGFLAAFLASPAFAAYPSDCPNQTGSVAVPCTNGDTSGANCPPPWQRMCIPRFGHSSTLMPDGNILVCGGVDPVAIDAAGFTAHCELSLEGKGLWIPVDDMSVARASHTATLLADGRVLVTGGRSAAAGLALTSAEVYDSLANNWSGVGAMSVERYDHTANLVNATGKVLVCGGQRNSSDNTTINADCDLFDPALNTFPTVIPMITGRARHTATTLRDGRIFVTGGMNPNLASGTGLTASEIYDENFNTALRPAHGLQVGRAYHRAVEMGDGRVMIVGGHNERRDMQRAGILEFSEIYDPLSDSIRPAGRFDALSADAASRLPVRVQSPSMTLNPSGSIELMGGLGNITTTFLSAFSTYRPGNDLVLANPPTAANVLTNSNAMTAGAQSLTSNLEFFLGTQVSGIIKEGGLYFSSATLSFNGGEYTFNTGDPNATELGFPVSAQGHYFDLAGTTVDCVFINGTRVCGHISGLFAHEENGGLVHFRDTSKSFTANLAAGGSIAWTGGELYDDSPRPLDPANAELPSTSVLITGLPSTFWGHNIVGGTLEIENASLVTSTSVLSITDSNQIDIGAGPFLVGPTGDVTITGVTFDGLVGTASSSYDDNGNLCGYTSAIAIDGTDTACAQATTFTRPFPLLATLTASVRARFVYDGVNMDGVSWGVAFSTVIIRSMVFGDAYQYNPQTELWSTDFNGATPRTEATATMMPNASMRVIGGKSCYGAGSCAGPGSPVGDTLVSSPYSTNNSVIPILDNWELLQPVMINARGNHTATPLPDQRILITGGTNGQSVLNSSEFFDSKAAGGIFYRTVGQLRDARDLHTATMLPNGRVLVTGGFTTNAISSAATDSAELFYPESQSWVPTSPMSLARDQHTATLLPNGNVLVFGGFSNTSGYIGSAQIYYSTAGSWRDIASPAVTDTGCGAYAANDFKRARHSATLLQDGRVFIFGGINQSGVLNTAFLYDSTLGSWRCAANRVDRNGAASRTYLHTATLLPSGVVLTAGGDNGAGAIGTAIIYDPATNLWTQTRNDIFPRFNHTATLLPNGIVLVAGGASEFLGALIDNETFDLAASSWATAGRLTVFRAYHTTSVLGNGSVVNLGGYDGIGYVATADSNYFMQTPDSNTKDFFNPSIRKSSITSVSQYLFNAGSTITLRGRNFGGFSQANGGGDGSSDHFHPRVYLQSIDSSAGGSSQGSGGFIVDLTTRIYNGASINGVNANQRNTWPKIAGSDVVESSITVKIPSCDIANGDTACEDKLVPFGWYNLRVANNGVFSDGYFVHVGPELPKNPVTITASTAPVGVILDPIFGSSNTIVFTWPDFPASEGIAGYNMYSSTTGVWISSIATGGAACPGGTCSFAHTGLAPNTTESVKVAAFNISGDGPLATSATTYTLSTAPISVRITTIGVTSLNVTWNVNNNAVGTFYEVSVSSDDLTSNGQLPFTTSFSTPYPVVPFNVGLTTNVVSIDQLTPNTTYYLRVRAYNANLIPSNFSALSSATTLSPITGLVGLSGDNCAPPAATTCILWQWTQLTQALNYKVYNATSGAVIAVRSGSASNFYYDTPLSTNTERSVRISAVTAAGEGPLSASVTFYTDAAVPTANPPVPILGIPDLTPTGLKFQWDFNQNPFNTTNFKLSYGTAAIGSTLVTNPISGLIPNTAVLMSSAVIGLATSDIYIASVAAVNISGRIQRLGGVEQWLVLGTTATLPVPVTNARITAVTPTTISLAWDRSTNVTTATYIVTISSDDPTTNGNAPFSTVTSSWIAFPQRFNGLSTTITGLLTSKFYNIRIFASNVFGQLSTSVPLSTTTTNGGAAAGSLGGLTDPNNDVTIEGTLGDGRYVAINVPAGSFPVPVNLSISSRTSAIGQCPGSVDLAVDLFTDPNLQPVTPIVLLLKYRVPPEVLVDELAGMDLSRITLFRYDQALAKCVPMPTTIDTVNHVIIARINHLTPFIVGQLNPSATPETTRVFPNPFFANTDGFMTFQNMPPYSRVRIFTMRGDVIYDRISNGAGLLTWPGINKAGRSVASGVYFAAIESTGTEFPRKLIKIAVLK